MMECELTVFVLVVVILLRQKRASKQANSRMVVVVVIVRGDGWMEATMGGRGDGQKMNKSAAGTKVSSSRENNNSKGGGGSQPSIIQVSGAGEAGGGLSELSCRSSRTHPCSAGCRP